MLGALALAIMVSVITPNPGWALTTVFDVSGNFDDGTTLTGSVTIDVTAEFLRQSM
jgi:hypothetical protein